MKAGFKPKSLRLQDNWYTAFLLGYTDSLEWQNAEDNCDTQPSYLGYTASLEWRNLELKSKSGASR